MKFDETINNILNESYGADITPKELDKLDDDMRRMIIYYNDGEYVDEFVEDVKTIKKIIKKGYKWTGKVYQDKGDSNKYVIVTAP